MNPDPTLVDRVAAAVLYEGYVLYPYRRSLKNQQRWTFGGVYPRAFSDQNVNAACTIEAECLLEANPDSRPLVKVRFLQPIVRHAAQVNWRDGKTDLQFVDAIQ